jgi:hypothetical protein
VTRWDVENKESTRRERCVRSAGARVRKDVGPASIDRRERERETSDVSLTARETIRRRPTSDAARSDPEGATNVLKNDFENTKYIRK